MTNSIKLNLGCGKDIQEGYINIDIRELPGVDLVRDLREPLPYNDYCIDEIRAIDVLEHFSWRDTDRIFKDWVRVLKPGGLIIVCVPNIKAHIELLQMGAVDKRYDGAWGYFIANIFGGQDYEGNYHKTTFTQSSIKNLFEKNGLIDIEYVLSPDERAITIKGFKP